jgi:hypothetical protein
MKHQQTSKLRGPWRCPSDTTVNSLLQITQCAFATISCNHRTETNMFKHSAPRHYVIRSQSG